MRKIALKIWALALEENHGVLPLFLSGGCNAENKIILLIKNQKNEKIN